MGRTAKVTVVTACLVAVFALVGRAVPFNQRKTPNVILVTADGLRWQEVFAGAEELLMNKENGGVENVEALRQAFWRPTSEERRQALLPFLWNMIGTQGQIFGNANKGSVAEVTNGKKFSYPGYNEMLAGFADARIDSNDKRPNPNPNVLEWLNGRPGFQGRVAAFCSWDVFPFILRCERNGLPVNAGWAPLQDEALSDRQKLLNEMMRDTQPIDEGSRFDAFTFYAALEHVKKHKPRVLYLAFDETDNWAHQGRYDRYLHAARRADRFIQTLWDAHQAMPEYRGRTSLLVTTDHGRGSGPSEWRNHGEKVPGAEHIWIAVLGPDVPALGERTNLGTVTQSQVAATLAALLGEDYRVSVRQAAEPIALGR